MSTFRIEVAWALPDRQTLCAIEVAPGTTVGAAIGQSGILALHPEIDLAVHRVGVYGKLARLEDEVGPDDRVEIYRPLQADPKASRHERVRRQRAGRDNDRNMRA